MIVEKKNIQHLYPAQLDSSSLALQLHLQKAESQSRIKAVYAQL